MESDTSSGGARSDREFFRVRTRIPLRVTPVEASDYARIASGVLSRIDPPLPEVDAALIGWLDRIERKLNTLLSHHDLLDDTYIDGARLRTVELSGSGLSFVSDEAIPLGAALLLEFELPETPVRSVRCLGRVVDEPATAGGEGQEVGVGFETIRQSDRDAVVRHTLAVQRQTILADTPE